MFSLQQQDNGDNIASVTSPPSPSSPVSSLIDADRFVNVKPFRQNSETLLSATYLTDDSTEVQTMIKMTLFREDNQHHVQSKLAALQKVATCPYIVDIIGVTPRQNFLGFVI